MYIKNKKMAFMYSFEMKKINNCAHAMRCQKNGTAAMK